MHLRVRKIIHPIMTKKKQIAIELFGGECFFCDKKFGKYFAFHHLNYDPTRKTYSDFKNKGGTIAYHIYLLPEVIQFPERFLLLCRAHHDKLEWAVSIKNDKFWTRFLLAIICTDPSKGGESKLGSATTRICLENNRVVAYNMNNNSSLKRLLAPHCKIESMFGETPYGSE